MTIQGLLEVSARRGPDVRRRERDDGTGAWARGGVAVAAGGPNLASWHERVSPEAEQGRRAAGPQGRRAAGPQAEQGRRAVHTTAAGNGSPARRTARIKDQRPMGVSGRDA